MVDFELESGEQLHAEAPDTFWIPPLPARQSLSSGDIVKLVFRIEEDGEVNVERMWVVIQQATTEGYVGILDNDPYCTDQIQAGLELKFAPKHIIDIYADD
ncbi:hypothetical protein [Rheinheimera sp. WS51]|uniref:hypothetical protein n=1 Tax=Rheinheimera sp. WS51 TaxID=3425886 RepID=UPI003D8BE8F9